MSIQTEKRPFKRRLIISLLFTAALLGCQAAGWYGLLNMGRPVTQGDLVLVCTQLILSVLMLLLNLDCVARTFTELTHLAPGAATLALLGFGVCFGISVHSVITGQFQLDLLPLGAIILLGWCACRYLCGLPELLAAGRLAELKGLVPTQSYRKTGQEEELLPLDQFEVGDLFVCKTGERYAFDGRVLTGVSAADESGLTGEAEPVEKIPGSRVLAGTLNLNADQTCMVDALGPYSRLGRVAIKYKKVVGAFTRFCAVPRRHPVLLLRFLLGGGAALLWLFLGRSLSFAIGCGVCVLFAGLICTEDSLPGIVGLKTASLGLRLGFAFDTLVALDTTGKLKNVVMLKSNMVTNLTPRVTEIYTKGLPERFLMGIAASLSIKSTQPLADSMMDYATAQGISVHPAADFEEIDGCGVTGKVSTKASAAGSLAFIESLAAIPDDIRENGRRMEESGCETMYFSVGGVTVGVVGCVPVVNDAFAPAVDTLKQMGLHTVLLTPDEPRLAANLARQAGLDEVVSELAPEAVPGEVARLQAQGPTALIASFVHDTDALKQAGLKIALGMEKDADLSLLRARPVDLASAVRLSRSMAPRRKTLLRIVRRDDLILLVLSLVLPPLLTPAPALALIAAIQALVSEKLITRALNPTEAELSAQAES